MSLSIFLPTRKNSQRVPEKNTREFSGFQGGLLELKLQQLIKIEEVDEIVLSTNDERSLEIGRFYSRQSPRIRLDERPDHLASSETNLTDLITYAAGKAKGEHILWTHVTSPFCNERIYKKIISEYFDQLQNRFDSLMTGRNLQDFLWDREKNDLVNRTGDRRWPQTQDLKTFFKINNAAFLSSKNTYQEKKDRIGTKPFLFKMDKITSLDIDDVEDFKIAEAIYERIIR